MKQKLLCIVLALVMMISVVGCGDTGKKGTNNADSKNVSNDSSVESEDVADEEEEIELTLWVASKNEDDFTKRQDELFMEKYPNIKLNKVVHEGDPGNDFIQGVAAGNAPDLVEASYANIIRYNAAGIITPLDEYFANWDGAKSWGQKYIDQYTFNDSLMALPSQGTTYYLAYNKKLFEEAGIDAPPTTWDEMLDIAVKLTNKEKQQWGYNMLIAEWSEWFFQYYVWQAGGDLTKKNDDGTLELTFTDQAVIDAANFYSDLHENGAIQSDVTMKFTDLVEAFAAGKVGMMMFATDWVTWVSNLGMDPEDIGLAKPPVGPAGKPYVFGGIGGGFVINENSLEAKKDAAWKYISFRSTTEYYKEKYIDQAKMGPIGPYYIADTEFDLSKYVDLNPEWVKITAEMKPYMRDEFYGKGVVGKYIDRAVQEIALSNADAFSVLEKAQQQAMEEAVEKFNEELLSDN